MTAAEFLTERRDFLDVRVIEGRSGGYDIVLRLDGTYNLPRQLVEEVAGDWLESLRRLTDLPAHGWDYQQDRLNSRLSTFAGRSGAEAPPSSTAQEATWQA